MPENADIDALTDAFEDLAKKAKGLRHLAQQAMDNNTTEAIDWAGVDQAAVDARLAERNKRFDSADVANIIGSLDQFRNLRDNNAVTQGDHKSNFEKLCPPVV